MAIILIGLRDISVSEKLYLIKSANFKMTKKTKSNDDMMIGAKSIAEEANLIEGQTEWLKNDLVYLSQSPLDMQLRAILGSTVAESFLHPTIKDKKKVKIDSRYFVPKKHGAVDAHELWNNLRAHSKSKLAKEENKILSESWPYENKTTPEKKIFRHIKYSRHRTDLMHRVSQMNRAKTKGMLKDFFLPSFDEDFSDLIKSGKKGSLAALQLPSNDKLTALDSTVNAHLLAENSSKMRFISEQECRCLGQFRERMEDMGVAFNVGISVLDKNYKGNNRYSIRNNTKSGTRPELNKTDSMIKPDKKQTSEMVNFCTDDVIEDRDEFWEPLTLEALIQHGKQTIDVDSSKI